MKGSETQFRQGQVRPFLKSLKNTWFVSVQQVAISGTPDILLCMRGLFVGLELKRDGGKLSALQKHNLDLITRAGGLAICCDPSNWGAVKAMLLNLSEGDRDVSAIKESYHDPRSLAALEQPTGKR